MNFSSSLLGMCYALGKGKGYKRGIIMDIFSPESDYDNNYFAPSKNVQNPLSALWALSDLELSFKTSLVFYDCVSVY